MEVVVFNMLKAFVNGFTEVVKNPFFLIPSFVAVAFNVLFLIVMLEGFFDFIYEVFVLDNIGGRSLFEIPFYLLSSYFVEFLVLGLMTFAGFAVSYYISYVYAAVLSGEEKGIIPAMVKQLGRIGEIIGLTFFTAVAVFVYSAIAFFFFLISFSVPVLGTVAFIVLIIWFLLGAYAGLKLLFTPYIMAIEKQKLKTALAETWEWSAHKLISLIVLFVILGFISGAITDVFAFLGDTTTIEILSLIFIALGIGFGTAYYHIVLIQYYLGSKAGK